LYPVIAEFNLCKYARYYSWDKLVQLGQVFWHIISIDCFEVPATVQYSRAISIQLQRLWGSPRRHTLRLGSGQRQHWQTLRGEHLNPYCIISFYTQSITSLYTHGYFVIICLFCHTDIEQYIPVHWTHNCTNISPRVHQFNIMMNVYIPGIFLPCKIMIFSSIAIHLNSWLHTRS
jgi:hypothetical protein